MKTKEPVNRRKEQFDRLEAKRSSQLEALLLFWEDTASTFNQYANDPELSDSRHSLVCHINTCTDQIAQIKAILAARIGRSKKRV